MFSHQMIVAAGACNLTCTYCFYVQGSSHYPPRAVTTTDIVAWLERCARGGIPMEAASVTGGEPLLRPDIDELLTAVGGQFRVRTLLTNGVLIGRSRAHRLADLDYRVHISVDHISRNVSDTVRGGTRAAWRGVDHLLDAGVPHVQIAMVVTAANWRDVGPVLDHARQLGIHAEVIPVGVPQHHPLGLDRLSASERGELLDVLSERATVWGTARYRRGLSTYIRTGRVRPSARCAFIESSVFIDADGSVHACGHGQGLLGTIHDDPTAIETRHRDVVLARRPARCVTAGCLALSEG